jgi:4-hydroxybenzoate polyprenyltransferase
MIAAEGAPDLKVLGVFVLGVILMRSAGCVINDFADRKIDPLVERTRERPIAASRVSAKEALGLFVILCVVAFLLVMTLNRLTILLSFVAVGLAIVYPFMKRYTYLPQVVLGMAFGWAIPMGFAAQTGSVPQVAWLLFVVNIIWSVVYDTMYAMADKKDDLKAGVKSTAILFGDADRTIIGLLQLMMLIGLIMLGRQLSFGFSYYMSLIFVIALGIYQQFLIRQRQPKDCINAFLNNNWTGGAITLGIALNYL